MKRTPNHSAWMFVDKREDFEGSNLFGEAYAPGSAPWAVGTWLSEYEAEQYNKHRERITYVVTSFYTPIAYYVSGGTGWGAGRGWYKVGQVFSSFTSRHAAGALRNVPGHMVVLKERRGDNTVECLDCGTTRHFTYVKDARAAYYTHR